MKWVVPALFVAMSIWTVYMWRKLDNPHRLIAVGTLAVIAYVLSR
jgi:hypothetical protein